MTSIKISNKEYEVKEVKYKDFMSGASSTNKEDSIKLLLQKSTGMTDEEFENLSIKDGIKIQKLVNEVNGLTEGFL